MKSNTVTASRPGPFEVSNVYGSSSDDYSQFTLTIRTPGRFPIGPMAALVVAAPELLASLKSLVEYEEVRIAHLEAENEGPLESLGPLKVELYEARAAIAKAEDRTV